MQIASFLVRRLTLVATTYAVFWAMVTSVEISAQDTGVRFQVVQDSALQSGNGLAASYESDQDVATHPSVVFSDDFENGALGERWDEVNDKDATALRLAAPPVDLPTIGRRSLCVTAQLNKNMGGGLTKWFKPSKVIFIRFYTYFDPQCDYVHHFCTLRANKSLNGVDRWSGFGGAGEKPVGDERFSTAIEPWGNWAQWSPPGKWNFYSYWHEMLPSPDGRYWGNSFSLDSQETIERGRWICVELMLVHNKPGEADGEQAYWIDGKLRGHWNKINWRTSDSLWANAFTLESYVTDRWTKNPTNIVYFDNVVIAREYIGPAGIQ